MIAFTITLHCEGGPRDVEVRVYESLRSMRSAAACYDDRREGRQLDGSSFLGICHRFEDYDCRDGEATRGPLCAIVRLAKPHIGVGIVSHELAHAAVWLWELEHPDERLEVANDEWFCWTLGELVRQTVDVMQRRGVYD